MSPGSVMTLDVFESYSRKVVPGGTSQKLAIDCGSYHLVIAMVAQEIQNYFRDFPITKKNEWFHAAGGAMLWRTMRSILPFAFFGNSLSAITLFGTIYGGTILATSWINSAAGFASAR